MGGASVEWELDHVWLLRDWVGRESRGERDRNFKTRAPNLQGERERILPARSRPVGREVLSKWVYRYDRGSETSRVCW